MPPAVDVIWCSNRRSGRGNGWSFPPAVAHHLKTTTRGLSVFHPFGGRASFGIRGDIDWTVRPNVIADAWLPPFREDAFDVVILDPPYHSINQQMKQELLRASAFVARKWIFWFHTMWIANGGSDGLRLERAHLVRVGDSCAVRCLQQFSIAPGPKALPRMKFTRGPAIRYNRWLAGEMPLPFPRE